ncbi:MAG: hypothetical protein OEW84_06400, partial [Aigarchaeota archaeon]|nr:hypothetical protein [Aigarchaeota archaeon]
TEEEALDAIDSALSVNVLTAANLSEAESNLVDTSSFMTRFQNSKELLNLAWEKLEEGDYAAAKALAIRSRIILQSIEVEAALVAEKAKSLLEDLGPDRSMMEGEIFFADDSPNNVVVQAQGHKVTFSGSSPQLGYTISGGNGEGAFEANVFALIEFDDHDGDNEIDEDEVVKVLQLNSLDWTHGQQNLTEGDETTLQAWYHFLSTEYEIWILMNVFEVPLIKHFSSGNDTVVYFIEGNAMDVKLDLIVNRWPWSSEADKLALRVFVAPNQQGNIEAKKVGTDEEWLVLSSDERSVRIKVVTKAEVLRLDDLSRSLVEVKMSYRPLSDGEILVDFVYPNFGEDTLIHDPQFGIGGPLAYIPILSPAAVILVLSILPIVLLPMRRRLESLRIRAA